MAKINVTRQEFADLVVAFLFDKLLHPEEVVPDDLKFNDLVESMRGKGLRSLFMNYYLDMDPKMRVKYKRIKDVFDRVGTETSVINISPEKKEKPKSVVKKKSLLKKVVGKLLAHKELEEGEWELISEYLEPVTKDSFSGGEDSG